MKKRICILANVLIMMASSMGLFPINDVVAVDEEVEELVQDQYVEDNYHVVFEITDEWENHYNANITIENISDVDIENWEISFKTDNQITIIWGAEIIDNKDDAYVVKNAGWNQDIKTKESITFGFTATFDEEISEPTDYYMTRICQEFDDDYEASYSIENLWSDGCIGKISIKNISDKEIEDWKISFDTNLIIKSMWNAQINQYCDGKYYVNNSGYNSNIKPQESVEIGFEASYNNNIEIKNILLYNMGVLIMDDTICNDESEIDEESSFSELNEYDTEDLEFFNNELNNTALTKKANKKYSKEDLKKDLGKLAEKDVSVDIVRKYNSNQAINIIFNNNSAINTAATQYGINKALIQALLFRELTCLNYTDDVADSAVINYFNYMERLERYSKLPWQKQIIAGPPKPSGLIRADSSTGLGQIFAQTGIKARNATLQNGEAKMNYSNWKHAKTMWYRLKDNKAYNITMVARVLKMETKKLKLSSPLNNTSLVLSRYNDGTTTQTTKYGKICNRYFNLFKKYNG